jgi:hypothetical protein
VTEIAFYCASSELYFPGAVGLVNSLRLHGHDEPIYVLDCGLTPEHRELLATEATIVSGAPETPPYLLKTIAPLRHPAEVMVLIDADIVVTRPLAPLIQATADCSVVAFKENVDRFFGEWGPQLDLGPARPQPYVSSGLVVLAGDRGAELLALWDDRQSRVDFDRSWFARNDPDYPFRFIDQDVLNAILCTVAEPGEVAVLDTRLAPHQPYRGLRIVDEVTLRCAYRDGIEPFVLHQYLEKPWIEPIYHGPYSRLLSRLWLGPDVAVPFPEHEVPLRMRNGLRARLHRKWVDFRDLAGWYVRDVIPEWIAARRGVTRERTGPQT